MGGSSIWLRRHESKLAVDPVVLGEIRFGILLLDEGAVASGSSAGSRRGSVGCLPRLRWPTI
jgi:hypothetical protein